MADKLLTPQQELFLASYTNPKSDTFSNALQSALKAGYSQEYSESITSQMPDWLLENLGKNNRLRKAEKVLDEILDLMGIDEEGKVDNQLLKTKADVAKFYAKALDKATYSDRTEVTGKDGKALIPERAEEIESAIDKLINKNNQHESKSI